MPPRRTYVDGPSESQKLYGANLPPSLRWGAAKKHADASNQEPVPRVDDYAEPYARKHATYPEKKPEFAFYRKRDKRRNATVPGILEYKNVDGRKSYAADIAVEDDAKSLLQDVPEQQLYTEVRPVENSESTGHVQDWLEKSHSEILAREERVVLQVHHEDIGASRTRKLHATVHDASDDSDSDLRVSIVAGAERGSRVSHSTSLSRRTASGGGQRHARNRRPKINGLSSTNDAPVFPKIHVDYISTQTLRHYDIPWEYAKDDPNYVIILRELDKHETDVLFEHTRRIRGVSNPRSNIEVIERRQLPRRNLAPWFQRCWSVRPRRLYTLPDNVLGQPSRQLPVVTEITASKEGNIAEPFTGQRISPSKQNSSLAIARPTLKRVVHATYGELLKDRNSPSSNPPGFIAVPQMSGSQGDALYHVLHLQQDMLDFEKFKRTIVNLPELHTASNSINDHLNKAQRLHEQLPHDGNSMRGMDGFCHHTHASAGHPSMTLISMPFLQLREHSHRTETKLQPLKIVNRLLSRARSGPEAQAQADTHSDSVHLTRTLFQYLNPRDSSRRDLKQVVCQVLGPADKRYLCVSQVWILIVNEELMITCSTLPEFDMYDGLLLEATAQTAPPKRGLVIIHVESEDEMQWLLRPADCPTYLDFAAHFSDITHRFADDFKVYLDGSELKAHDWAQTMKQARSSTMRLRLRRTEVATDQYGSTVTRESVSLGVRETPQRKAIVNRLAQIKTRAPLCGVGDDESEDLEKLFRSFVKEVRQHQDRKSQAQPSVAEELAAEPSGAHSSVSETVSAKSDAMGPRGSMGPPSNASTASDSGEVIAEDANSPQSTPVVYPEDSASQHAASGGRARQSGSESSRPFDPIHFLPKTHTQARVLARMGVAFDDSAEDSIATSALDRSKLFDVMRMTRKMKTLEELRKITYDSLDLLPEGAEQEPTSHPRRQLATKAVSQPGLNGSAAADADLLDENELYDTCRSMTSYELRETLISWKSDSISHAVVTLDVTGFDPKLATWSFCRSLGFKHPKMAEAGSGFKTTVRLQGFEVFGLLLNGLRLLLIASNQNHPLEVQTAEKRLTAAVFGLITTLHHSMELAMDPLPKVFLNRLFRSFAQLFDILNRLEMHALTIQSLCSIGGPAALDQHADTLKHMVIAILLATTALAELEGRGSVLQAEAVRKKSMGNSSSRKDGSHDYSRVEECCGKIYGLEDPSEPPKTAEALWQPRFEQSVDRLKKLGWDQEAARVVLRNECRWKRATRHANRAAQMLESSFKTALCANPAKKIQWKAAALPTDLVALLVSRLLWRPILDGQDALDMYNRYATDLETNILTGEPSREPLDRIRYLRHELNAFSQVQREQIDVLEQITSTLIPSDEARNHLPNDPHPRHAVFATLPKGVKIQNDIVQMLSGMLDGLQSEARAQISGVQDWRDNAGVVFTIITVIFLPLSFVASVFGMNTSDVRDMALTQWVFWTSASSFTVLVILITVYFVDVPPLWRWLERKGGTDAKDGAPSRTSQRNKSHFFASLARQGEDMAAGDGASEVDVYNALSTATESSVALSEAEVSSSFGGEA